MTKITRWISNEWAAALTSVLITSGLFCVYLFRTLGGDLQRHILSGEMFGMPKEMLARGLDFVYFGDGQTGWDGQFYYYISNDLFAQADTQSHLDAPSYRYQRIGFSALVKLLAVLTGQTWHAPSFYFMVYAALVLAATIAGAKLLKFFGASPWLILLWSLSVGTHVTLFNALPDAAADSFVILALYFLISKQNRLASSLLFTAAALSREVYVLIPVIFFAYLAFQHLLNSSEFKNGLRRLKPKSLRVMLHELLWALPPLVAVVAWQAWIIWRFEVSASSQASGILSPPFSSLIDFVIRSSQGQHPLVGTNGSVFEFWSLLFFALVLTVAAVFAAAAFWNKKNLGQNSETVKGLSIVALALSALYFCFGPTVMMHYTGYLKALGLLLFLVPIIMTGARNAMATRWVALFLAVGVVGTGFYNFTARISAPENIDALTNISRIQGDSDVICLQDFRTRIEVLSSTVRDRGPLGSLLGQGDLRIYKLRLENSGPESLTSSKGLGSVMVSYHLLGEANEIVGDGVRTALIEPLLPGQSRILEIPVFVNKYGGAVAVELSAVQEGCAWFYLVDARNGTSVPIVN